VVAILGCESEVSQRICPFCKLIHAADSGQCLLNALTGDVKLDARGLP
jgi:hypothetical protein